MKKLLLTLICLILCLALIGCGGRAVPSDTDEAAPKDSEKSPADDTQGDLPDTSDEATGGSDETADSGVSDPDPEVDPDPEIDPDSEAALVSVRQSMIETTYLFAAYYIGITETVEPVEPIAWMQEKVPGLCSNLPFLTAIPASRVLGEKYGELYCIVPRDENASVAVNTLDEAGNVTQTLYRSESGEPLLVFCNRSGTGPDTQISIVGEDGGVAVWSPGLDEKLFLDECLDADGGNVMMDCTPYTEILQEQYDALKDGFWVLPEAADLIGTSWQSFDYLSDGTELSYSIDFFRDKAFISWVNVYGESHNYDGYWSYDIEDGVFKLKIDLGELDGERSFCILVTSEQNQLYLSQDFAEGYVREYERTSRVFERTFG